MDVIFPLWQYNTYKPYASLPPSLSRCRSKRSVQSTKQENRFASASWLLNLFANLQPILILSVCLSVHSHTSILSFSPLISSSACLLNTHSWSYCE